MTRHLTDRLFLRTAAAVIMTISGLTLLNAETVPPPAIIRSVPAEPVHIGTEPQFVFDLYVIDNHWALERRRETFRRVFHQPRKHAANPLGDFPSEPSWITASRDEATGVFRLWYQSNLLQDDEARAAERERKWRAGNKVRQEKGEPPLPLEHRRFNPTRYQVATAYSESPDGIHWTPPALNQHRWPGTPNNIVLPRSESAQLLLDIPEEDRRGYRYLMLYRAGGLYLVGSEDGIRWDTENACAIAPKLYSDHPNTIVYDPVLKEYVLYCRPKHLYHLGNDPAPARRVARLASKELWTDWTKNGAPQTIVAEFDPTDQGFNFSMAMPVRYYGGVYWGFLEPFRYNDYIWTELAFSRDGVTFQRLPERPKFVELGEKGLWDDTMLMVSPAWVEHDDQWYFFYCGGNGPHGKDGGDDRKLQLGLATLRKEGLISMRAPEKGGIMVTRSLVWPGGDLLLNLDARGGVCRVAVSDAMRGPIPGFSEQECEVFDSDAVAHRVSWGGKSLDALRGQTIRLEFHLEKADFYTFRASGPAPDPETAP